MTDPGRQDTISGSADPTALPGLPQSFIDAGDVPWSELEPLLVRLVAEILPGEVLEVQSGDPTTLRALPCWCAGEGHTLIHAQPGNGHISFWIGKNA
jgi:TusA-related sulfurtransferase